MTLRRLFRAATCHLPSIRNPSTSRSAHARSAPPASLTPPPPPPPAPLAPELSQEFTFPPTSAYDPTNMVASSSSGPATVEVLSTQSLRPLALEPSLASPLFVDKFVITYRVGTAPAATAVLELGSPTAEQRSTPSSPPLPHQALP